MDITASLYKEHRLMIDRLANRYSKTTGVDANDLAAHAWAKLMYAERFYDESKRLSEKSFIYMVAKSAMNELWEASKKEPVALSYETLTSPMDDEQENATSLVFSETLSSKDDQFMAELQIDLSEEAFLIAKAMVEEDMSKNQIMEWGKKHNFPASKLKYFIFELQCVLSGKKVRHA